VASAAIVKALAVRWDITASEGIGCGWAGPVAWSRPWQSDEILTALAFLRMCRKSRTSIVSSYRLKHLIETWGKTTGRARNISNGSTIIAALALGFHIEDSIYERNPNADIYVNAADVDRLIASSRTLPVIATSPEVAVIMRDGRKCPVLG
jgi:hypothetical protein